MSGSYSSLVTLPYYIHVSLPFLSRPFHGRQPRKKLPRGLFGSPMRLHVWRSYKELFPGLAACVFCLRVTMIAHASFVLADYSAQP